MFRLLQSSLIIMPSQYDFAQTDFVASGRKKELKSSSIALNYVLHLLWVISFIRYSLANMDFYMQFPSLLEMFSSWMTGNF